ncbi:MAG: hypothetical protein WBS54_05535 [Acidobacteriota bacterium]
MSAHSTARSRSLGNYFRFKGILWAGEGLLLFLATLETHEMGEVSTLRLFAFYLLLFAAPGVLLVTLGSLVRLRLPVGWWLSMAYLSVLIVVKTSLGFTQEPVDVWFSLARRVPPHYLVGLQVFGIASAVIYALDIAAFVAFLSPKGRECYGVRRRSTPE